jgi:hypothetical protein
MKKEKKEKKLYENGINSGKRNTHASPYFTTIPHSPQPLKGISFFFFFLLMVDRLAQTISLTKMTISPFFFFSFKEFF